MLIFWAGNLTLDQYLGSVNSSQIKIQYLGFTNLKKGIIVQFGVIHYSHLFNKCHSAKWQLSISGSAKNSCMVDNLPPR